MFKEKQRHLFYITLVEPKKKTTKADKEIQEIQEKAIRDKKHEDVKKIFGHAN